MGRLKAPHQLLAPKAMYRWRQLNDDDRKLLLKWRKVQGHPVHSPHHIDSGDVWYHVTAACYEHLPQIGKSSERLSRFAEDLLAILGEGNTAAWVVLPNHYHALVRTPMILDLLRELGALHGRTSHLWNGEEGLRGRKVWCKAAETAMKGDRHFHATVNYLHHNAVKHGYVERWTDWPWSSASGFLESRGREEAMKYWREYPVLDYGKGWDDPEL